MNGLFKLELYRTVELFRNDYNLTESEIKQVIYWLYMVNTKTDAKLYNILYRMLAHIPHKFITLEDVKKMEKDIVRIENKK